jgi:hypothetical protein
MKQTTPLSLRGAKRRSNLVSRSFEFVNVLASQSRSPTKRVGECVAVANLVLRLPRLPFGKPRNDRGDVVIARSEATRQSLYYKKESPSLFRQVQYL